jgi:hypothetical protein
VLLGSVGGASGVIAALLGFSSKTPANKKEKEEAGAVAQAGNIGLGLAVPLFVVFFLAVIALGTTWLVQEVRGALLPHEKIAWSQHEFDAQFQSKAKRADVVQPHSASGGLTEKLTLQEETSAAPRTSIADLRSYAHLATIQRTSFWEVSALALLALLAAALSTCIGVNRFSMHALYRNRLIRAYLGASRYTRNPNPFTGFDENDNLPMSDLRPELLWATNLKDAQAFFNVLTDGKRTTFTGLKGDSLERRKLAQYLWSRFYDKTRQLVGAQVTGRSIDAVIRNINVILSDERDLLETKVELPEGFWATRKDDQVPYPPLMRNRAVLDFYFQDVIRPMALPKDEKSTSTTAHRKTLQEVGKDVLCRPPLHVVNMALNLVSGEKLAWQQRMAESFTY